MNFLKTGILTFFCLIFSVLVTAQVITVTSTADSGPGTLREALTQAAANGSTTVDEIHFNLPGTTLADRTITLLSELPHVRSKTIIDATTQPGAKFGRSDAKVAIRADRTVYANPDYFTGAFFIDEAESVEIYGFYIHNFYDLINKYPSSGSLIDAAIYVNSSADVIIGAPGKGNVMENVEYGVYVNGDYTIVKKSERVKVQSNWVGLLPDGTVSGSLRNRFAIFVFGKDSFIGGDAPRKGNLVAGYSSLGIGFGGVNAAVRFNRLGLDLDMKPADYPIKISSYSGTGTNNNLIADNVANLLSIELSYITGFSILRNKNMVQGGAGIRLERCEDGTIGSDLDLDKNTMFGNPVVSIFSKRIQLKKNSISCTTKAYATDDTDAPKIEVLINTAAEYSGTASPNSEIYIYNDNTNCDNCNPVDFTTKVTADAAGTWKITGNFAGMKLIANATLRQTSSEYTMPEFLTVGGYQATQTNPSCSANDGTLKLSQLKHVIQVEWYNEQDQKVADGQEARNLAPGRYYAKGFNGQCFVRSANFILVRSTIVISATQINITQPGCGVDNGSIRTLNVTSNISGARDYKWTDKNNRVVGTTLDAQGLGPGEYTFTVSIAGKCAATYGPVILVNTSGPTLTLTGSTVKATACGQATGSITGITASATGTVQYTWRNARAEVVGNALDLVNIPAGTYRLEVKDQSACGLVLGPPIEITEQNGVMISGTPVMKIATCGSTDGSLTGLQVSGATRLEWLSETGAVVGSAGDLLNVAGGKYKLRASNAFCSRETPFYTIDQVSATVFPDYPATLTMASCGVNNGSIRVDLIGTLKPASLRWVGPGGASLGTSNEIRNLNAGNYQLFLTDAGGCQVLHKTYTIGRIPMLNIETTALSITPDICLTGAGSLSGLRGIGGLIPYTYTWTDKDNRVVATGADLNGIKAGTYKLTVTDALGASCTGFSQDFVIPYENRVVATPQARNVSICAPGQVLIKVTDVKPGRYRIYQAPFSAAWLDENDTGTFKVIADGNTSFYISYVDGNCESDRFEVKVTVAGSDIFIPNTITPNGDGVNDTWEIAGIESYENVRISLFNRYGQNIFQSQGYKTPFNGIINGNTLTDGTYYYMINLREGCQVIKGSLLIVR